MLSVRHHLIGLITLVLGAIMASAQPGASVRDRIIIDTDIGDDVDDAFAVYLALASPEFDLIGVTTAWGDTALRARMVDRMLCETGRTQVVVRSGIPTASTTPFTQAPWASAGAGKPNYGDGVAFLLDQIRAHPGEITLIALGPLTNIAAAIDRDPSTFGKLKRVVMMGGAIYRGYDKANSTAAQPPEPEYNIARDPKAAQKLFRSGIPIYILPLDSTQIRFDKAKLTQLTTVSTPMTDSLQILVAEWSRVTNKPAETLFDAVAVAYAADPQSCAMTPVHIEVDDKGMTKPAAGVANAQACLRPNEDTFFALLMPRLLRQRLVGGGACLAGATH